MTEELLTPEQVAGRLKMKTATIRLWLRNGKMKGIKIAPKAWRIRESDLQEFLNERSAQEGGGDNEG